MKLTILLLVFLISTCMASWNIEWDYGCPQPEAIGPKCTCKRLESFGPMMLCDEILSSDELADIVKATTNNDVSILTIIDSSLLYIPDGAFENTHFNLIHLDRTELMSFAESDEAFKGLEDSLRTLTIIDGRFAAQWSWNQLRNLRKLQSFRADWISLESIAEPFPPLNLTTLSITSADISHIVSHAFSSLKKLTVLELYNNNIREINRNMFPYPAKKLRMINLNDNELETLPNNIFSRMPKLTALHLGNNRLTTVNEIIFSPIMANLNMLDFYGNNLLCDCRVRWLLFASTPENFNPVCSKPNVLSGERIKSIGASALYC